MINLISNELTKIFKKKSTYVMFIFILIFVGFTNYLYKNELDENGNYKSNYLNENYISSIKEELSNNEDKDDEYVLMLKKDLKKYELVSKYKKDSWQQYIIENNMDYIIECLIKYDESTDEYKNNLYEYNIYIEKFDNNDYKYFINKEIEAVENTIDELKSNSVKPNDLKDKMLKQNEIKLEVLNYRLDNNIDYGNSYINTALNNYLNSSIVVRTTSLEEVKKEDKLNKDEGILYKYYTNLSDMNINKYILDEKIDANKKNDTRGILINLFTEYEIYIVFAVIMFTSAIISYEYSNGTIKQLLLTPHTRIEILLSKLITCLIMSLFTILLTIIFQLIVGGISFGLSNLNVPVVVYNFTKNTVQTYNIFHYLLILTLSKLPMIIILILIVLLISIITASNSLSMVIGIIIYISSSIINSIATYSNLKIFNLLIFSHWDYSIYLFGMIPQNYNINLTMSIMLTIIYLIVLIVPIFVIFNRKDIKNV